MSACFKQQPYYTEGLEGAYVRSGELTYQVQLSRELNPFSIEDKSWLRGLGPGTAAPDAKQTWFGVWMRVENESETAATSTSDFTIEDTAGIVYHPTVLTASNPFRYTPVRIPPHATIPLEDSTAAFDPTQGQLLLFKLDLSSYQDRPLTLHIASEEPLGPPEAKVTLDL